MYKNAKYNNILCTALYLLYTKNEFLLFCERIISSKSKKKKSTSNNFYRIF